MPRRGLKPQPVAPLTAATLIAQQVGPNAIRDGLFLSVPGCLEKAPERRPASAAELWRELGDVTLTTA